MKQKLASFLQYNYFYFWVSQLYCMMYSRMRDWG